jgi:hypothetical protein
MQNTTQSTSCEANSNLPEVLPSTSPEIVPGDLPEAVPMTQLSHSSPLDHAPDDSKSLQHGQNQSPEKPLKKHKISFSLSALRRGFKIMKFKLGLKYKRV